MKNWKFTPMFTEVAQNRSRPHEMQGVDCLRNVLAQRLRCTPYTASFRTIVKPSCLTAPVIMQGCDFSTDPSRCRHVELKYRPGCAEVQVKKPDPSTLK